MKLVVNCKLYRTRPKRRRAKRPTRRSSFVSIRFVVVCNWVVGCHCCCFIIVMLLLLCYYVVVVVVVVGVESHCTRA
jgi:hypothetical protein